MHGLTMTYRRGCRCLVCARAWSLYRHDDGRRGRVDAAPAREHLQRLAAHGIGLTQAARLSALSRSTLQGLRSGQHRTIPRSLLAAVLAIAGVPAPGALTRAWPSRRLLRWLALEGFTQAALAERFGLRTGATAIRRTRLRLDTPYCTYHSAVRLRALYRKVRTI